MEDRFVSPGMQAADEQENRLRPQSLREFIGQDNLKKTLEIYLEAARMRGEPLDHMLLYGPPGLGKTCLSHIVANEMNAQIRIAQGPAIEKPGDLVSMLTNLNNGDVLFIDEIHRLSRTVEEYLYPAMEDYVLDLFIGQGPSARSIRFNLPRFTLVGATTKAGSLASPLRDRFGIQYRLEPYEVEDLITIVKRSAGILGVEVQPEGAREIALRSRGTPRVANRLLARVRDFASVKAEGLVTREVAADAMALLDIDELGLDRVDRTLLHTMIVKFEGKPVGLNTLSAATGEDSRTIEDVYEPYLLQLGFLMRTPSGRVPTQLACRHMGLALPEAQARQMRFGELNGEE